MTFLPASILTIVRRVRLDLEVTPSFPIDLAGLLAYAYPVTMEEISGLSIHRMCTWFEQHKLMLSIPEVPDRPLFGCLIACQGQGWIFLEKLAPPEEKRFTLAHEFGHYVIEHLIPRETAIGQIGDGINEVLDGKRASTWDEQLMALRKQIDLQPYCHFMERGTNGQIVDTRTTQAEIEADFLALELLAPYRIVLDRCGSRDYDDMQEFIFTDLTNDFGLPAEIAQQYAVQLTGTFSHHPSLSDRLGL